MIIEQSKFVIDVTFIKFSLNKSLLYWISIVSYFSYNFLVYLHLPKDIVINRITCGSSSMYRLLYSIWFRVFQGMQARIRMRHIKKKMSKAMRQLLYDWSRWAVLPSSRLLTWYVLRKGMISSFQLTMYIDLLTTGKLFILHRKMYITN